MYWYMSTNILYTKDFHMFHMKGMPLLWRPLNHRNQTKPQRLTCHLLHPNLDLFLCEAAHFITPLHPNTCFGVRTNWGQLQTATYQLCDHGQCM